MDYFDTSRLCPGCKRSKRPPLSVINSLVANLQTAHIKFPEGEALKLLVDRIKLYKVEVENLLKATNLLGVKDLNYNKGRIEYIKKCSSEKNILKKDNIKKNEDPDNNENSTIDFSGVIQRIALLTEREIRSIKKLLLEGNAIEASIIQRSLLLRVLKIRDHVNKENRDQKKCSPSPLSSDSTVPVKNSIKSDCGASSSDTNDTSKGKSPSKLKRKRTCKQPRSEVGSDEKGTAEDEEDCAVMNCLRPVGVKVDWVQCDHCLQWYHLICIKLKKCSIKEDQEFFCKECLKHNNFPKRYRK